MQPARTIFVATLGLLLGVAPMAAQQVRRTGHGTPSLDVRLDNILRADYRVVARDTTIARDDTLRGPVLTLGNRLVIEGTILGNLAIVDANVYARPGSRIAGEVYNIGGGFYKSEQAVITGAQHDHPLAPYHVERDGETLTIVGDTEQRLFKLDLRPPIANRVEGVRPFLGVTLSPSPAARVRPALYVWGAYAIEAFDQDDAWQGGAELRLRRGFTQLAGGIEKTTLSNDDWIYSDLDNSVKFILRGKDHRNYYHAVRPYVALSRDLLRGSHEAILSLRAQREDGYSMVTSDPWVLLKPDTFRTNPRIDDGIITSGILSLAGEWTGASAVAEYDGRFELARAGWLDGDFDFNMFVIWAEVALKAIADHTLRVGGRFQAPLGTDSLPRQRWGMLGGSGTLYTFGVGQFFGDRVVYVETMYSIPLGRRVRLPVIGSPAIQFLHHAGMAWSFQQDHELEQNVGLRIKFPLVYARVITNPRDTDQTKVSFGITLPKSGYPWERRRDDGNR